MSNPHAGSARRPPSVEANAVASFALVATLCPLLAGLPAPLMAAVAGHARWRYFRRGEVVVQSGRPSVEVLVIAEGALIAAIPGLARPEPIRILRRGHLCGELALLGDMPPVSEIRALSNGAALALDGRDVKSAIREDREFAARIIRHLCAQTRTFEMEFQVSQARDASARLADVMLTLSALREPPRVDLTQVALAGLIGVTRETVGRILKRWRREGLVATTDGQTFPRDMPRLRREASMARR